MTTCYEFEGTRYIRNRHNDGCEGDCSGCQQCGERHCGECSKGVHLGFGENTCPACIGHVRRQLREIVDLAATLPDEAEVRGVHSEAANLHGPYADPEAFAWRRAARAQRDDVLLSSLEGDDEHHPGSVLKRWVQALCEDYGDDYDRGDDLASLTDWLDSRLHRIANDVGQDFGQFKREVGRVVSHLEAVLHAGEQRDVTRVPCLDCGRRLERRYGTQTKDDHHACPNLACKRMTYSHGEYVMAKRQWLNDEGADRHVKMQDARDVVDRPRRTWSKWLRLWYVRSYTDRVTGQVWVWWPDVREIEAATPRRNRAA